MENSNKIQLVLLEDNVSDIALIEATLKDCECCLKPIVFSSIREYEQSKLQDFDIIIADLNLTDSSGVETIKKLIKINNNRPIIVLSGYDTLTLVYECIKAGASVFISKNNFTFLKQNLKIAIITALALKEKQTKILEELHKDFHGTEN